MSGSGTLNCGKERKVIPSHSIVHSCIVHRHYALYSHSVYKEFESHFPKFCKIRVCLPFVWHRVELYVICLPQKE